MSRGTAIKRDTPERLTLLRPMVTRRYELVVDHEKCCGCQLCSAVCPQEAITLSPVELKDGRLTAKPRVDIDETKCSFCGECVVVCPVYAFAMTVNGKPELPVVQAGAFPELVRSNVVDETICQYSTDVSYIESCPVGAIRAEVQRDAEGGVTDVRDVKVALELCISCTRCMEEGPRGAFTVIKPYQGRALLNTMLCPAGCQACADVCPTNTIVYDGERVALDRRFCLFCGACEEVCPVEGAVRILRSGFVHTPVESAAWMSAVEKLVSFFGVVREYDIKSQRKRRQLVLGTADSSAES